MSDQVAMTVQEGTVTRHVVIRGPAHCCIGRSRDSDVYLASPEISRCHCEIDFDLPCVTVRDLGSRNGTYVNEVLIGRRDPRRPAREDESPAYELRPGDVIRVGPVELQVEWVEEPADEVEAEAEMVLN